MTISVYITRDFGLMSEIAVNGGELIYVLDRIAAKFLWTYPKELSCRGILLKNMF